MGIRVVGKGHGQVVKIVGRREEGGSLLVRRLGLGLGLGLGLRLLPRGRGGICSRAFRFVSEPY